MSTVLPDGGERYQPDDECPLFSERLEAHLVQYTRGEVPNAGRFCGNCYTPMSRRAARCGHCGTEITDRAAVASVPEEIVTMLRQQRKTESWIVNAFAFTGLTIAIVGGLAIVLGIPPLRENLIAATFVYAVILLVGGRALAGIVGGYYGDRVGYTRARTALRESWAQWIEDRDHPAGTAANADAKDATS